MSSLFAFGKKIFNVKFMLTKTNGIRLIWNPFGLLLNRRPWNEVDATFFPHRKCNECFLRTQKEMCKNITWTPKTQRTSTDRVQAKYKRKKCVLWTMCGRSQSEFAQFFHRHHYHGTISLKLYELPCLATGYNCLNSFSPFFPVQDKRHFTSRYYEDNTACTVCRNHWRWNESVRSSFVALNLFSRSTFSDVILSSHLKQQRTQSSVSKSFFLRSHKHCFAHKICTHSQWKYFCFSFVCLWCAPASLSSARFFPRWVFFLRDRIFLIKQICLQKENPWASLFSSHYNK